MDPPNFLIQVANGQIEKQLATTTLKFDIGDYLFAEHFIITRKSTGLILGLHFIRNNSVVIDTTYGLMHFRHLTIQVETASSETTAKPPIVITENAMKIPRTIPRTTPNHSFCWPSVIKEHDRDFDTIGEIYGNSKFADFPFNVENIWQENNSQGNEYNPVTISNQKEYTECVLRNQSGAIQAH